MGSLSELVPDAIKVVFEQLDDNKKNIFTKSSHSIHKSIYVGCNYNFLAAYYMSKTFKLGYRINIPNWFICADDNIFTFFNNLVGDIIKGNKMTFKIPTIQEIKKTFNFEKISDVIDIFNKNNPQEILRFKEGNIEMFFGNQNNFYKYEELVAG